MEGNFRRAGSGSHSLGADVNKTLERLSAKLGTRNGAGQWVIVNPNPTYPNKARYEYPALARVLGFCVIGLLQQRGHSEDTIPHEMPLIIPSLGDATPTSTCLVVRPTSSGGELPRIFFQRMSYDDNLHEHRCKIQAEKTKDLEQPQA